MLDNQLITLVRETIIEQEAIAGIPGLPIKQAFQPTQQGVDKANAAYMHKLYDRRVGSPHRADIYDADLGEMVHTDLQQYETTFQISTLATQNPETPDAYTASDIANLIAYILQSDETISALREEDVGILRVTDVRNPYFHDDRARNEASPSFDFTLTHKQIVGSKVPVVQSTEFDVKSV